MSVLDSTTWLKRNNTPTVGWLIVALMLPTIRIQWTAAGDLFSRSVSFNPKTSRCIRAHSHFLHIQD